MAAVYHQSSIRVNCRDGQVGRGCANSARMAAFDVNQLFARAEALFATNQFKEASRALEQIQRLTGDHPAVLHLTALVEKNLGSHAASAAAFAKAVQLAPRDPKIQNNYANLLEVLGERAAAFDRYRIALDADPAFSDARLNLALLLQKMGKFEAALAELDTLLACDARSVRAHSARGSVLRELARFEESAASYEAALALAPSHARALDGRARVALESGQPDASVHYRRALAADPSNLETQMGLADALEAEGDAEALAHLDRAVSSSLDWIEGQQRLAEMRAEHGEVHFTRSYETALAAYPENRALHHSHWRALALGGRYVEALEAMAAARGRFSEGDDTLLMKATFLSEAGRPHEAAALFKGLGDEPDVVMARGRTLLRLGEAASAATLFEQVIASHPGDISAWAHLGLAWRLAGDARHEWLCQQHGVYGAVDLDFDEATLARLAEVLRRLHRTDAHPIGQSLRGGTQTRGRLFWRFEPEIAGLYEAILAAVGRFVSRLPAADPSHPLLRHRDGAFAIEGSWSVRLAASGFHINHIHPHGVLSSACYIALPDSLGGDDGREGWLELGAAPVELGLDLGPIATVEPRPGRLALFPSYLYHGTRPFASGERLTVAFDVAIK